MSKSVERRTVDLSAYPDLVVIYLGMRVRTIVGLKTLLGFGPKIAKSAAEHPDGLLQHETFLWSLFPPHAGIRQYWRDSGGTGFWHETYFASGGVEAVYDDMARPTGLLCFAPAIPAKGPMFSARQSAKMAGLSSVPPPIAENDLYRGPQGGDRTS